MNEPAPCHATGPLDDKAEIHHYAENMPTPHETFQPTGRFSPWNTLAPPKTLYHYTDAPGALGILSSSQIWASDAFFMNDTSELRYGLDIITDAWTRVRENVATSEQRECLDGFLHLIHGKFADFYSTYLSCFCEGGNLLSQWRGYGKPGSGFALGFDGAQLKEQAGNFRLVSVEYDERKQRHLCEEYFKDLCGSLTQDDLWARLRNLWVTGGLSAGVE